jgi:hypothetical protein
MNTNLSKNNTFCSNSVCKEGAGILLIVREDNRVAFLKKRLAVNEFIQSTKLDRSPEKRFRFFDKCVKGECQQLNESRRSLIDNIVNNSNENIRNQTE